MKSTKELAQQWADTHKKIIADPTYSNFRELSSELPAFSTSPVRSLPRAVIDARLGEKVKVENSFFYYDSSNPFVMNALVIPAFSRLGAAVDNQAPPGSLLRDTYGVGKTRFVTSAAKGLFAKRDDFIFVTIDRDNYQGVFQNRKLWSTLELITHRFQCANERGGPLHPKTFALLNEPMPGYETTGIRKGDMIDRLPRKDLEQLEFSLRFNDGLFVEPLASAQASDGEFRLSLDQWHKPRTALAFPEPTALGYARLHPDVIMQAYVNEWGNFRPDQQKEATPIISSLCSSSARSGSVFSTEIQGSHLKSLPLSGKAALFVDYNPNDSQQIGGSGMIHSRLRGELLMPLPSLPLGVYSAWMEGLALWKDVDGVSAQQDPNKFLADPQSYLPFHQVALMDAERYLSLITLSVQAAEKSGRHLVSSVFQNGQATDQIEKFYGPEAMDAAERALSHEQFFEMRQIADFLNDFKSLVATFGVGQGMDTTDAIMSSAVTRFSGSAAVKHYFQNNQMVTAPYKDVKGANGETFRDVVSKSLESIRNNSQPLTPLKPQKQRNKSGKSNSPTPVTAPLPPPPGTVSATTQDPSQRLADWWMSAQGGNLQATEVDALVKKASNSIPNLATLLANTPDAELRAVPAIKLGNVVVALLPTNNPITNQVKNIGESDKVLGRVLSDSERQLINAYFVKAGAALSDLRNVETTVGSFYVSSNDSSVEFRNLWYKLPNTPSTPQVSQLLDTSKTIQDLAQDFSGNGLTAQLHRAKTTVGTPSNRGPDHLLGIKL